MKNNENIDTSSIKDMKYLFKTNPIIENEEKFDNKTQFKFKNGKEIIILEKIQIPKEELIKKIKNNENIIYFDTSEITEPDLIKLLEKKEQKEKKKKKEQKENNYLNI